MSKTARSLVFLLGLSGVACDPFHKDKCEWFLVPEPKHINLVEPGWVSLCARNFVINKERCYLKATLEYAKAVNGKAFRLSTMKVKDSGLYPREVESIKACKPDASVSSSD